MKARIISEGEKDRFNQFVSNHPKGHILQSFEWGQVKKCWESLPLIIEKDDKIIASILLLKRKLPMVNKTIFYAPRGPVVDQTDENLLDFLLKEVEKLAKEHQAIFLKIDPDTPIENNKLINYLERKGFNSLSKGQGFQGVQPRSVFRLDLTPSEDDLFANFKSKTRYNIRYAEKKGVRITEGSFEDLKPFYEILVETAVRDKFRVRSYAYYVDMWNQLYRAGYLKLFLAYAPTPEGDKLIAGTLAFIFGDKAWYIYGASSNSYRNFMPNYLLQWSMIKWAKNKDCSLYDFRGVPSDISENSPLYGLYRFKVGFGGNYTKFVGEYNLVYSKFWCYLFEKLINFKTKIKR